MVELISYNSTHFESLSAYELDEEQSQFTRSVSENIIERKIQSIPGKFPVTILYNQKPVGFFVLDNSDDKFVYTKNKNALLIRSLSLNPAYQGKGIGKTSMLKVDEFVSNYFPEISELVLAVNFRNEKAYHLYSKVGFKDDGVVDGIKGPQHVMVKAMLI